MIATLAGGVFFYAVHIFASKMPSSEYGVFNALLQVLNQMAIPSIGLQTIFMQQTAMGTNDTQRRELAGAVRSVLKFTLVLWLLAAIVVLVFQKHILLVYKINNPVALWGHRVAGPNVSVDARHVWHAAGPPKFSLAWD